MRSSSTRTSRTLSILDDFAHQRDLERHAWSPADEPHRPWSSAAPQVVDHASIPGLFPGPAVDADDLIAPLDARPIPRRTGHGCDDHDAILARFNLDAHPAELPVQILLELLVSLSARETRSADPAPPPCRAGRTGGPADHTPPASRRHSFRSPAASPPAHRPRTSRVRGSARGSTRPPDAPRPPKAPRPAAFRLARMRMRLNMAVTVEHPQSIVNGFVAATALLRPRRSSSPRFAPPPVRRARCRSPGSWSSRSITRTAGYYRRPNVRVGRHPGSDFYTASDTGPLFGELVATAAVSLLGRPRPAGVYVCGNRRRTGPGPAGRRQASIRAGADPAPRRFAHPGGELHRLFQRAL
jgi:hypothetical protein